MQLMPQNGNAELAEAPARLKVFVLGVPLWHFGQSKHREERVQRTHVRQALVEHLLISLRPLYHASIRVQAWLGDTHVIEENQNIEATDAAGRMQASGQAPARCLATASRPWREACLQPPHQRLQLQATRTVICDNIALVLVKPSMGQYDQMQGLTRVSKGILWQLLTPADPLPSGYELAQIAQSHKLDPSQSRWQVAPSPPKQEVGVGYHDAQGQEDDQHHRLASVSHHRHIRPQRKGYHGLSYDAKHQALVLEVPGEGACSRGQGTLDSQRGGPVDS
mmetsp:Transcript_36737/g.85471  ORF Transcript_36737/g.85471 Transcript_36737/m.85471 type:complete len:279 (-) Transcript_36737:410-1246(-)